VASVFRSLPSVDRLIGEVAIARPEVERALLADVARETLARARARLATGDAAPPELTALVAEAQGVLDHLSARSLRPVVNATGVILHTNLGRAPLSRAAVAAMSEVALAYSNLEFDLDTGERGSRATHLRQLLQEVTGAEDGLAVNNNASALLLTMSALAAGREVVVSRGQAVEIGGGFRIPDVLRQSGARMVEVGTTNRTYASDYAAAIGPETALLLRVHPSNFRIEGFVHSVAIGELVEVATRAEIQVLDDVGSGALLNATAFGLRDEPIVQDSVRAGADVVCFSGDKLLGGPQAGVIVGRRAALEPIRRHPLARAVRIDKVSLAGLEATLGHYRKAEATREIPVWRMIATPVGELERRARAVATAIGQPFVRAIESRSTVGGGSLPQDTLPSFALLVGGVGVPAGWSADVTARKLRRGSPPIVGRIDRDALLLDFRTVAPEDDPLVIQAVRELD
jgi:L-seryl-tRNA(Ser) seleniumtransferase